MGGRRRVGVPRDWLSAAKPVGSRDRQIRPDDDLRGDGELV